jgi:hypothetical protein
MVAIATGTTAVVLTLLPGGGAGAVEPGSPAPAGSDGDTVVYTLESKHGKQIVTVHDLADTAGADRLRTRLRGTATEVIDAATAARRHDRGGRPPSTTGCRRYGAANSWCGHVWSYQGLKDPRVYVRDRTPAGYPVRTAVVDWNRFPGVDARYRTYWSSLPSGRHLVVVRTYTPTSRKEFGSTRWVAGTQGPVTVSISTRIRGTTQARKTACHEIGHALGLDHNDSTRSCMHPGTWHRGLAYRPSSQDGRVLTMVYPRSRR